MDQKRLIALALLCAGAFLGKHACAFAAQSRFVVYGSLEQCTADHVFPAPACIDAFARARSEFEARTPSFPTAGACAAKLRDCMAWPPGTGRVAVYRPRWAGVEIVDTPREKTVTPTLADTRLKIAFVPQSLTAPEPRPVVVHRAALPQARPMRAATRAAFRPERELSPGTPPPGSGFKVENGVLTFPAPARFQPRNLPKGE